jgi:type III protein arginine methyltransferase
VSFFQRKKPAAQDPPTAQQDPRIAGDAALQCGNAAGAIEHFREAIRLDPRDAIAHCNLGLALHQLGDAEEAREMLRRATELDPGNADFAANLRIVSTHAVPLWHFSMMNDAARNDAYEIGIRAAVKPGDTVLEIGTGSGLLAMMAARAGAAHVYTCEMVEAIAGKAREIVEANGYAAEITIVASHSSDLDIPAHLDARANVLVSEILASDLLGEGLLEAFEDARERLLVPGARVIPRQAWVRGRLVSAKGLERFVRVGQVSRFDLSSFNDFSPLKVHPGEVEMSVEPLSEPFDIFHFDFEECEAFPAQRRSIPIRTTAAGACAGVLQWIKLDLGGGASYENADDTLRRAGHWQQVLHLFPAPLEVTLGAEIALTAAHNRGNLVFHAKVSASYSLS